MIDNLVVKGIKTFFSAFSDETISEIASQFEAAGGLSPHLIRDNGSKIRWGEGAYVSPVVAEALADRDEKKLIAEKQWAAQPYLTNQRPDDPQELFI